MRRPAQPSDPLRRLRIHSQRGWSKTLTRFSGQGKRNFTLPENTRTVVLVGCLQAN